MATTHPLADALCTVAQEMHAIAPSVSAGQACWSFDTIPFVGASFIKRAGASAHQELAYLRGKERIETLLQAISQPMQDLPALAGARFHWRFTIQAQRDTQGHHVMLSSWNETLVQGTMPTMTATIRRFVDTLVQRPPHNGLVFDLGRRAIPAANVHEALLVWTAFTHQGYLEPSGLQDTLDTLRKTPLTHNLAFAHVHPDTLRAMLPTP